MSTGGIDMNQKQAQLLMAAVILTRSSAYIFSKTGLETLGTFNLLAARFLLGFFVLLVLFRRQLHRMSRGDLIGGAVIGAVFTVVMALELTALKTTDTSTVSFLENTAVVYVPLIEALLIRRLPKPASIVSAALALCGVGLLTLRGGAISFTPGELLCLGTAVLYAVSIIVTDRFSHRCDALLVGIVEVGAIGVFSLVLSLILEQPRIPAGGTEWGCVLVLALLCTGFGFTLQPVAQSHLSSQTSGLMCALNPAFAALLGVVFLGEAVTVQGVFGALLILSSLFVPHLFGGDQHTHHPHFLRSHGTRRAGASHVN